MRSKMRTTDLEDAVDEELHNNNAVVGSMLGLLHFEGLQRL